jgi:hypothetical protein
MNHPKLPFLTRWGSGQSSNNEYTLNYRGTRYTFYVHNSINKVSVNPAGDSFIDSVREQLLACMAGRDVGSLSKFFQDYLDMVAGIEKLQCSIDQLGQNFAAQTKKIASLNERLEEANVINASLSEFSFGTSEF